MKKVHNSTYFLAEVLQFLKQTHLDSSVHLLLLSVSFPSVFHNLALESHSAYCKTVD